MEILQIEGETIFLKEMFLILEKKAGREAIWFIPRIFFTKEDAIAFIKKTQDELIAMGLYDNSQYFIFKADNVS